MIPVDLIDVLNPRERNKKIFEEVVGNIKNIGLKKPITVTPRKQTDGTERYLLVCGEGRLKAFKALCEPTIPALVIAVNDDDAFIMSLSENIARVKRRPLEILAGIDQLREKGYSPKEIADKTGLNGSYVHGILTLLQQGEERLLVAVEEGRVPLTATMTIAGAGDDDTAVQVALQEAYETGKLRGKGLSHARRLIDSRKRLGRSVTQGGSRTRSDVSTSSLVRTYQKEVERQKLMVKKAEYAQQRLLFVVGALRQLFDDENFANLLRAEQLDTLPKYVAERVWSKGNHG
jgi:ParB family transcriptional regulator, chromosome partitioning protein